MAALVAWKWPGNIRELENFLERAVILSRGPVLHVPLAELETEEEEEDAAAAGNPTLQAAERDHILRALREAKGIIGGPGGAADGSASNAPPSTPKSKSSASSVATTFSLGDEISSSSLRHRRSSSASALRSLKINCFDFNAFAQPFARRLRFGTRRALVRARRRTGQLMLRITVEENR